ncbi:MAG: hybrid sensor histidine kinase/response regulator, partial [Polyangia bacterium]
MRTTNKDDNGNGHKDGQPPSDGTVDHKLLLATLLAVKKGDFSVRLPVEHIGVAGKIYDTLNDVIELEQRTAQELARISQVVGKEGKINQRASLGGAGGQWQTRIEHLNSLVADLLQPTAEVARVIGAVAKGDLVQNMALEIEGRPLKGEFMRTAKVVNTMVEQLGSFASEV